MIRYEKHLFAATFETREFYMTSSLIFDCKTEVFKYSYDI